MEEKSPQKLIDELETKEKIDFSIKMRNAALESADRRQQFEWKFCILVWTAIGSIIGILLINKLTLDYQESHLCFLICFSVAIMVIVICFQFFCWAANQPDKRRGEMYEKFINEELEMEKYEEEFNKALKRIKPTKGLWSPILQVAVTLGLLIAFIFVYYLAISSAKNECCDIDSTLPEKSAVTIGQK